MSVEYIFSERQKQAGSGSAPVTPQGNNPPSAVPPPSISRNPLRGSKCNCFNRGSTLNKKRKIDKKSLCRFFSAVCVWFSVTCLLYELGRIVYYASRINEKINIFPSVTFNRLSVSQRIMYSSTILRTVSERWLRVIFTNSRSHFSVTIYIFFGSLTLSVSLVSLLRFL